MTDAAGTLVSVILNGRTATTSAATLRDLVSEHAPDGARVATALNGEFVPERARGAHPLTNGDRVEILTARQGG